MTDLYALFQVSETNEMIILLVLIVMFFAIIYDILDKFIGFERVTNIIITLVVVMFIVFSGAAIRIIHIILSLGIIFGTIGFLGAIILMFIAFILFHFGLGKLAFWMRRRR